MTKLMIRGIVETKNENEYDGVKTTKIQHYKKEKGEQGSNIEVITVYIPGVIDVQEGDMVEYQITVSASKTGKLYYNQLTTPVKVK